MINLYAGIDVGGTTIKSSLVDDLGTMTLGPSVDTGDSPVDSLRALAAELVRDHPEIRGIGLVAPGIVDEAAGVVTYTVNLDIQGVPLTAMVEEATGIRTLLGHDGRAAGRAEAVLGAAKGASSFAVVPIGTGISAALQVGAHPVTGANFCAGEIGHSPVFPGGDLCSCGQRGCMETYASAHAIGRRYSERAGIQKDARQVEELLGTDPIADQVWADAVEALALGFTHLTLSFDPEIIVVGGGLSGAGDKLLGPLRQRMGELLKWREPPDLKVAELGDRGGRWGAAILGAIAAGSDCYKDWDATRPTEKVSGPPRLR